jgi:hypothetical protein
MAQKKINCLSDYTIGYKKKIETLQLFFATSIFEIHTSYVGFLSSLSMPCSGSYLEFTISNKT